MQVLSCALRLLLHPGTVKLSAARAKVCAVSIKLKKYFETNIGHYLSMFKHASLALGHIEHFNLFQFFKALYFGGCKNGVLYREHCLKLTPPPPPKKNKK